MAAGKYPWSWTPWSQWLKDTYKANGNRKPRRDEQRKWYAANAHVVWPDPDIRPTLRQALLHAKGYKLRPDGVIAEYWQKRRAMEKSGVPVVRQPEKAPGGNRKPLKQVDGNDPEGSNIVSKPGSKRRTASEAEMEANSLAMLAAAAAARSESGDHGDGDSDCEDVRGEGEAGSGADHQQQADEGRRAAKRRKQRHSGEGDGSTTCSIGSGEDDDTAHNEGTSHGSHPHPADQHKQQGGQEGTSPDGTAAAAAAAGGGKHIEGEAGAGKQEATAAEEGSGTSLADAAARAAAAAMDPAALAMQAAMHAAMQASGGQADTATIQAAVQAALPGLQASMPGMLSSQPPAMPSFMPSVLQAAFAGMHGGGLPSSLSSELIALQASAMANPAIWLSAISSLDPQALALLQPLLSAPSWPLGGAGALGGAGLLQPNLLAALMLGQQWPGLRM